MRYPKSLRIYIAGPMRHKPAFNFPAFAEARTALARTGHHVFSPADRDLANGFDPAGMTGDEDLAELGFDLRAALALDTAWICANAEAIALLPGWETSSGARAELALAAALGLQAGSVQDFADGTLAPAGQVLNGAGVAPLAPSGTLLRAPQTHVMHLGPDQPVVGHPVREVAARPVLALTPAPAPVPSVPAVAQATATSGEVRITSSTGAQKGSKIARYDLVPAAPLWELATLYGVGAGKYAVRNWEGGYPLSLSFAALNRHLWAWWNGENTDPEMGVSHLTNVAWHAFTLRQLLATHPAFDDRPASLILPTPLPTLVPVARDTQAEAA